MLGANWVRMDSPPYRSFQSLYPARLYEKYRVNKGRAWYLASLEWSLKFTPINDRRMTDLHWVFRFRTAAIDQVEAGTATSPAIDGDGTISMDKSTRTDNDRNGDRDLMANRSSRAAT